MEEACSCFDGLRDVRWDCGCDAFSRDSGPPPVGEKDVALLPVASCGRHGPVARMLLRLILRIRCAFFLRVRTWRMGLLCVEWLSSGSCGGGVVCS